MLFYPTSPVHVREIRRVAEKLSGWRIQGVTYEPLAQIAPGIAQALSDQDIPAIGLAEGQAPGTALPSDVSILVLGAVFEPFALELLSWAKMQNTPVAAIEEVAQLGLNDEDICNYDAPFDRLFVASPDELEHFLALGYPREMLQVSGLPAYERIAALSAAEEAAALEHLGIRDGRKTILYTTSPLRSRRAIHNKDTPKFRDAMLRALATTRELTQRRIVVKLHPNEDLATERTFILERIPDAIVVGRELTMETLFAAAAVVVNRGNSQTCMEAVLRGIPTVIAACGLHTLFHDSDVARIVGSTDAITNAVIDAIAGTSSATAAFRARHCVLPESGVSAFIARELKMLTERQVRATPESWRWLIKSMLFMGRHARALELLRDLTHPGTPGRTPHSRLWMPISPGNGQRQSSIGRPAARSIPPGSCPITSSPTIVWPRAVTNRRWRMPTKRSRCIRPSTACGTKYRCASSSWPHCAASVAIPRPQQNLRHWIGVSWWP
jgi:hypothetical protein